MRTAPAMADESDEFQVEDIEQIVKTSLQSSISQESKYDPETANTLSKTLLEACVKNLAALGKQFKYVVTAIIMQKNGAGLHSAMGAYWDARKDGACGGGGARRACRLSKGARHSLTRRLTPSLQARQRSRGRMRLCTLSSPSTASPSRPRRSRATEAAALLFLLFFFPIVAAQLSCAAGRAGRAAQQQLQDGRRHAGSHAEAKRAAARGCSLRCAAPFDFPSQC